MAYLDKVKLPDGVTYDLQGIEYIIGTQTAATNAWTGVTRSAELYTGKAIIYKLPQAGNSSNATLNLTLSGGGTTGAKAVQRLNNSGITTHYPANSVLFLVYDGDRWRHDAEYDSTVNYQLRSAYSAYLTSAALYRYQLLLQKNETTLIPVSNGNNSTTTGKTITTEQFDPFGEIYYYNSTNTIAANTAIPTWTLYQQVNRNLSYAFNITNTLTTDKDVYLVATPTTAGKAKLYSTPTTQALPTSDNGLIYIYLGHASANTNVEIHPIHPVYWYKNGAIVPWDPNGLKSVTRSGTTWTFTRYNGSTSTVAQQDNNTTYTMSISTAANSTLHLVSGSSTVANVTIPNTTNTTYGAATTAANGLMSAADKKKLDACSTVDHNTTYSAGTGLTLSTANQFYTTSQDVSDMMNLLGEGTSPAQLNDYLIAQYAGGGTTTKTYHRRKVSNVVNSTIVKNALGCTTNTIKYLREDGSWQVPPDNNTTYGTFSTAANGLVPKPTAAQSTAKYHLAANGTWVADADTHGTLSGTTGTGNYKVILSNTASTATIPAASTASAGVMTTAQASKLDGIAAGANKFTHPTHTAATVGPTANTTLSNGGSFTVPQVIVNSSGHVNQIIGRSIKLPTISVPHYGVVSSTSNGLAPAFEDSYNYQSAVAGDFLYYSDIFLAANGDGSAQWNFANTFAKAQGTGTQNITTNAVTNITLSTNIYNRAEWYGGFQSGGMQIDTPGYYEVVGSVYLNLTTTAGMVGAYIKQNSTEVCGMYIPAYTTTARGIQVGPVIIKITNMYDVIYLAARASAKGSSGSNYCTVNRDHNSTFLQIKRLGPIEGS